MSDSEDTAQQQPKKPQGYRTFLLVILFFSFYLSYLILFPFLDTLILAIVCATFFQPLQVYFVRKLKGRNNLAAMIIVLIITFVIALPVFFFTSTLVAQGLDTVNKVNDWIRAGGIQNLVQDPRIVEYIAKIQDRFPFLEMNKTEISNDILYVSRNIGQFLLGKVATILSNVASLIAQFFVMVFIAFYLVRDGSEMIEQARLVSPLRSEQEDRIINGIGVVTKSVLLGTFVTAICQGIAGGFALGILGFPGLFWGTMTALASLIPLIGTCLVWVPIAVYLLLLGHSGSALFLAIWSIILPAFIDNILRPYLMKGKSKMSPFYIFLAILGGVQYFGLRGILYGPLILSFAMIMLYIYSVEYRDDLIEYKQGGNATAPEAAASPPAAKG